MSFRVLWKWVNVSFIRVIWRFILLLVYRGNIWRLYDSYHRHSRYYKIVVWNAYMEHHAASISIDAHFASHPVLPHGVSGIFVTQSAVIGKNTVIFQQVTIGANTIRGSKSYGAPVIGDNVYIGAGAKVIGGVSVSDNVRIGANAVVVKDIPENALAIASETKVILKKDKQDNTFYPYL